MSEITNLKSNTLVSGTSGNDEIVNGGDKVTIDGGKGNDEIFNNCFRKTAAYEYMFPDVPNGSIYYHTDNKGSNVLFKYSVGDGNDIIYGFKDNSTLSISGGSYATTKSGNDVIVTVGKEKITLQGAASLSKLNIRGAVASIIKNTLSGSSVVGTEYNDTIENKASNVTIDGGKGNDSICNNNYSNVTMNGGEGNDEFLNWGSNVKVDGGEGNDSIANSEGSKNTTIFGGAGNDTVRETSKYGSTINGGTGNDLISLVSGSKNALIVYNTGDGDDKISGFNATSTLQLGNGTGTYSTTKSGNDIIVNVEKGKITLQGAATLSALNIKGVYVIKGTNGDDEFYSFDNTLNGVMIQALDGDDFISNERYDVTMDGGKGNDELYNGESGKNVSMNGGEGNDDLHNGEDVGADNVTMNGGAGDDTIENHGNNVTISGSTGNDEIFNLYRGDYSNPWRRGENVLFTYNIGDGDDVIYGFRKNSTLSIAGGQYVWFKNDDPFDNNVTVIAEDGGKIVFKENVNYGKPTIIGTQGTLVDKNYENNQDNALIVGNDSANIIKNRGSKVKIFANGGNDTIYSNGGGNDTIYSNGGYTKIAGGSGSDSIYNDYYSFYTSIAGGDGNDTIENKASNVTIDGGANNDYIYNIGDYGTIDGGAGDDFINNNKGKKVSINAGDGNNYIQNDESNVTIGSGSGNDTISNEGSSVAIDGGAGNDYIYNNGYYGSNSVTIVGGSGNDSIRNSSYRVTINAGEGNDSIWNDSNYILFVYKAGDGNDIIDGNGIFHGFRSTSTLSITGGVYATTTKKGNDVIVTVGNGEITLVGAASLSKLNIIETPSDIKNTNSNTTIYGTNANDTIKNTGDKVRINAMGGNDYIKNEGKDATINGGAGNDTLYSDRGSRSSISGAEGDDLIDVRLSTDVTIDGGKGNDVIKNTGNNVTISGGESNDTIYNACERQSNGSIYYMDSNYGKNVLFKYAVGDGNDLIYGFKSNSTLSIAGGVYASTAKSGNDIIVTIGKDKITLQGAATLSTVNIVETPISKNYNQSNTIIYGTNANDTITNSGDKVTVQALRGNDSIENKAAQVSVDGGEGADKIVNSGKNVTITPQDGNDTVSNEADNVTITGGAGNDSVFSKGKNVTINGGDGADTIENNSDTVSIAGAAGDDFIKNTGSKATIEGGAGNDTITSKSTSTSISTADGNDLISLSSSYKNTIISGKGSDTVKLDNLNSNEIFIQYNLGDGDDVIEGFNSTSTLRIGNGDNTYSWSISGNDRIITVEDGGKITLKGAATLANVNIVGVTNINTINTANEVAILGMRLKDSIVNRGDTVTIKTFAGRDTVQNYSRSVTIEAGADDDYIANNNPNNSSINAGDGDDDIINIGGYQNTILGGKGNDNIYMTASEQALVQYNPGDGKDYITDFNSTTTLQIGDGTASYYKEIKDDDVIIIVGNDKITLKGAATLSVVNILGDEEIEGKNIRNKDDDTVVSGTGGDDTVHNTGSNVEVNALGGNDSISNSGKNVTITGGAKNDTIKNTGDNITINGGLGNDQISNDKGKNVLFTYTKGDGNDLITGFNETSTLSISGGLYSLQTSGNDVIVKVDDGKITLAGAASLSTVNIDGVKDKPASRINNSTNETLVTGGNADDTVYNTGVRSMIIGYGGNDSIKSYNARVTVDGGAGNDRIINYSTKSSKYGNNSSLNGGEGNDYIRSIGNDSTLNGGDGDDFLSDYSYDSKIIGGKGDDTIYLQDRDQREWIFYNTGDGNDYIGHFNTTVKLIIDGGSGVYSTTKSGNNIIVTVGDGKITLEGAANLSRLNIRGVKKDTAILINNTLSGSPVVGTEGNDTINNIGEEVTISALDGNDLITNDGSGNESSINAGAGDDTILNNYAQDVEIIAAEGNDSIYNCGNYLTVDGGAGNDSITNDKNFGSSISGAEGDDVISVTDGTDITINGGTGNDTINIDSDEAFIEYKAGDGNDLIQGFDDTTTLSISDAAFSTATSGKDVIVTVGKDKITLEGAATLKSVNIKKSAKPQIVSFMVADSKVSYENNLSSYAVGNAYQFNAVHSLLNVNNSLGDNAVKVTNAEDSAIKTNGIFGTAILSSGNVLEYQLVDEKNNVALTSETYNDKISFSKDTALTYGEIKVELLAGSVISTKGAKEISFDNNSSANITAPEGSKINIDVGSFTVNNLPVNSINGDGTITVEKDGLSFKGYGVQFVDLEVAKESYFEHLAPMKVEYKTSDKSYVIHNEAVVKTLSNDFTKIKFDISAAEDYAYYEVNDTEFLVSSVADNINVVEADGNKFKIQGKELDAEKIDRVMIDEQLTFSGTEIEFDGVKVNYALNKPVSYSLDGKEITISDAATITTGNETKTFKCEAGSYFINGRSFETSADLTFSADANEIRIPLNDAATEIYFDGVKVSGLSDGGELVFDLANDKTFIPSGAILNVTSPDEVKLNLAAGSFLIDYKEISLNTELEVIVDKDDLKVPLSENPVMVNGAAITGSDYMTLEIDNTDALFFSILLPDGALVENVSRNTFELSGKDSAAYFGDTNKKVQLTEDGTAYIKFDKENTIGVGVNALTFEQVEILNSETWTVETSGKSGIDRITDITSDASILPLPEGDDGETLFEVVASDGNIYIVRGSSDGEINMVPLADEFKYDDSEAAGKVYEYDKAGDYTVNGITFHAEKDSKVQTITRGVEFDLSTGAFQYDGLTLEGTGTAKINRYNAALISLTDGATISGSDESKYYNRQFEINGAVELIGKKFETDSQTRCALLNVQDTWEISIGDESTEIPVTMSGFVVGDKYVSIHDDCYDGVKVVGGKLSSIEGVKNSAEITGNGLSNVTILTTESGEFSVRGKIYNISGDSDGVTFVTDSHGNVSEINGLAGSVEGSFENEISINGKAIRLTGASAVKVTSDGKNITEISDVAGDLTDDKAYCKNVRVYKSGGAEKLTTSADGTIIFSGNKFEASAGKTFMLDDAGNVSGIGKADNNVALLSAYVAETDEENFATINLSTTDGLEEVFGDFSEGLMVNGVFVKVTDSTNFVVKDDAENVYIETTVADTFTINGKTFKTSAEKTIFKLDADGNVCEIVTESFYPDKESCMIMGDFNDEIIFNGKKFCVTGTNNTSVFIGENTLITIELAKNAVKVVESGGEADIKVNGAGDITIGEKTFNTSDDFIGYLQVNSAGDVYSSDYLVGTLSGELGGLELEGITIDSEDTFSVTSDGEKITAIENLNNGSFTCDDLNGITINGAKVSVDNSDEIKATVTDGELEISELANSANVSNSGGKVNYVTKESGEFFIGEGNFKVTGDDSVTFATDENGEVQEISDLAENASLQTALGGELVVNGATLTAKDKDIIVGLSDSAKIFSTESDAEEEISDIFTGDAKKIVTANGRATIKNYDYKTGEAFITEYENIADAIKENSIAYDDGRLTIDSSTIIFDDDADSRIINFVDKNEDLQKVGFVGDDSSLDASKETGSLILVGGSESTLLGGTGKNQIYLKEDGESTIAFNGRNTINNFNADFADGDKISVDATTANFNFDGEDLTVKSGAARAFLENISSDNGVAKLLTVAKGKEIKTAIAQKDSIIAAGDELADVYIGEKSGVDFTSYNESLTIDLSKNFYGINQVTVGGGLNTLIGSTANETLAGNANGTTEFVFDKGNGRDVIKNFNFAEDKINVGDETITAVILKENDVRLQIDGDGWITLEDAQGKNFRINDFTALVDKNIEYDDAANYFVATSKKATLTVAEEAEIWLDGSHGKTFIGDIKTLDATKSDGKNSLVGNEFDNVILAGKGDASLWGGNGGDDLLVGGNSQNLFFYCNGNGNDTISGANDGDGVILADVSLDQISGTKISAGSVDINFRDGGSLHVEGNSDVTYQLADGSSFSANQETMNWNPK